MSRKTFSVETFKNRVNGYIATDWKTPSHARSALITVLEQILHESGNYNGFAYLTAKELDMPHNKPGINMTENDEMIEDYADRFADTDRTRIKYF